MNKRTVAFSFVSLILFSDASAMDAIIEHKTYSKKKSERGILVDVDFNRRDLPKVYQSRKIVPSLTANKVIKTSSKKEQAYKKDDAQWGKLYKQYTSADSYKLTEEEEPQRKKRATRGKFFVSDESSVPVAEENSCVLTSNTLSYSDSLRIKECLIFNAFKNFAFVYDVEGLILLRQLKCMKGHEPCLPRYEDERYRIESTVMRDVMDAFVFPEQWSENDKSLFYRKMEKESIIAESLSVLLNDCSDITEDLRALTDIKFLSSKFAFKSINYSIFRNSTTWNSYSVPEKSVISKNNIKDLATILIQHTLMKSSCLSPRLYDNLNDVLSHIKKITADECVDGSTTNEELSHIHNLIRREVYGKKLWSLPRQYDLYVKNSEKIVTKLKKLLDLVNDRDDHVSIRALKDIKFLSSPSAYSAIETSIFKDNVTWSSYCVPEKTLISKEGLSRLALILINHTGMRVGLHSPLYPSLVKAYKHIRKVTKQAHTKKATPELSSTVPVKTVVVKQKRILRNPFKAMEALRHQELSVDPISSRLRSKKNSTIDESSDEVVSVVAPVSERNITMRRKRGKKSNSAQEQVLPIEKSNLNITTRRGDRGKAQNLPKVKVKSSIKDTTLTPTRRSVQKHPNLGSSLAIAFVDYINSGNYEKASKLLSRLSGYQPASELRKVYKADIPNSLFASGKEWDCVDTAHINKKKYGQMALYLIKRQSQNSAVSPCYREYFNTLISEFSTKLAIDEQ